MGLGLFFCSILLGACVNHISEEEGDIVNDGDIPLKFIADIRESLIPVWQIITLPKG